MDEQRLRGARGVQVGLRVGLQRVDQVTAIGGEEAPAGVGDDALGEAIRVRGQIVFAVAITLLVLNLRVRGPSHGSLASQFAAQWPSYAALFVSFFVIGVIWINHHTVFHRVASVDRTLMTLNLVLLLMVAVFPFPTATLASYLKDGSNDAHLAAAVYGLVVEGVALSFTAICTWSTRRRLFDPDAGAEAGRAAARVYAAGALAIAGAVGLSFVSAILALAVNLLIATFFLIAEHPFGSIRHVAPGA